MVRVQLTTLDGAPLLAEWANDSDSVRSWQLRAMAVRPEWGHVDFLCKDELLPVNARLGAYQEAGVVRAQVVGAAKCPREERALLLIRSKAQAAALMAALDVWDEGDRRGLHLLCDGSSITGCTSRAQIDLTGGSAHASPPATAWNAVSVSASTLSNISVSLAPFTTTMGSAGGAGSTSGTGGSSSTSCSPVR